MSLTDHPPTADDAAGLLAGLEERRLGRRKFVKLAAAGGAFVLAPQVATAAPRFRGAAAAPFTIGLVVPLSGPFAREGQLMVRGATVAQREINARGGIKTLGGAKVAIRAFDAGASVSQAVTAAQRAVSADVSVIMGAFLSSFTIGVSQVTEQAQIPLLTLSFADSITSRGLKYVFQDSPVTSKVGYLGIPGLRKLARDSSVDLSRWASLGEDSASALDFQKTFRARLGGQLVTDETYHPPLPDPTGVVQKVKDARAQVALTTAYQFADALGVVRKMRELGVKIPVVAMGETLVNRSILETLGASGVEGLMGLVASFPGKGAEKVNARFKKLSGEPWMTQNALSAYAEVWIAKEAAEAAKSRNPKELREALAGIDIKSGPATVLPGGRVRFNKAGRRMDAIPQIVQWQNGTPVCVWPPKLATATGKWPKA